MDKKIKNILFVINGLGGGGSQRNVTKLANHFIKNNNVFIAVLIDYCEPFFELDNEVKVIFVRTKRKTRLF